MEYEGEILGPR